MAIHIGRTLPPATAPIRFKDIVSGLAGLFGSTQTVQRFVAELKESFGVRHCFVVSSGTASLVLVLQALKELHPDRDEVLVPAYTCYSVPAAVVKSGLRVRLCDLAPGSLDFDHDCLEKQLDNPRLLCVIPTHLFGLPADVERVKDSASRRGIFVVEDAAQAMGGTWHGKILGTQGDAGFFSMGRGKSFSTVEGGIILTNNDSIGQAIAKQIAAIPGYGAFDCLKLIIYAVALSVLSHPRLFWIPKSLPFLRLGETQFNTSIPIRRISSFQAGLAKEWRVKLVQLKAARMDNVRIIAAHGITPLGAAWDEISDLVRFPVLSKDMDAKKKFSNGAKEWDWGYPLATPVLSIESLHSKTDGTGTSFQSLRILLQD